MASESATLLLAASGSAAACARLLHRCARSRDLALGRSIHEQLLAKNPQSGAVANALIDMYAKCGAMDDARCVFEAIASGGDVVAWTSLIWGYAELGHWKIAMALLRRMLHEGVTPNSFTFGSVLKNCKDLASGARIHALFLEAHHHLYHDVYAATALVSMYGAAGGTAAAQKVFDAVPRGTRNVVTWSAMLGAYATAASSSFDDDATSACSWRQRGMELFRSLLLEGSPRPDKVLLIAVISLCHDLTQARICHRIAMESGGADAAVSHALIVMYARLGSSDLARGVFDSIATRDVVSWTSMIKAAETPEESSLLFAWMLLEGVAPNSRTLTEALQSCSDSHLGYRIHACARELGLDTDVIVGTALITMYARIEALDRAEAVFQLLGGAARINLVCWTAMISATARAARYRRAIELFGSMLLHGATPNRVSWIALLSACATPELLPGGRIAHASIAERGLGSDPMVANSLLAMYARCGSEIEARGVFESMPRRDAVSWSAMLAAIAPDDPGAHKRALGIFARMQLEGVAPSKITFVSLLDCCAEMGAARTLHARVLDLLRGGTHGDLDVALWNATVAMLARCGSLTAAAAAFSRSPARDLVSWNGIIAASARHSHWRDAIAHFRAMQQEGVDPDAATLLTIVFACDHGGMIELGCDFFAAMARDYAIAPRVEHCACVLDLLGRAGHLREAEELLAQWACADPVLWTSLLGSCRVHGDLARARAASGRILGVDPTSSSAYVVLSQAQTAIESGAASSDQNKVLPLLRDGSMLLL